MHFNSNREYRALYNSFGRFHMGKTGTTFFPLCCLFVCLLIKQQREDHAKIVLSKASSEQRIWLHFIKYLSSHVLLLCPGSPTSLTLPHTLCLKGYGHHLSLSHWALESVLPFQREFSQGNRITYLLWSPCQLKICIYQHKLSIKNHHV